MTLPKPLSWNRAEARQGRFFDGKFILGVMTTGVYCLPSCPPVRPSRRMSVVHSEAAAKAAGLRACKRCRPDLFYRGEDEDVALFEGLGRARRRPKRLR